MARTGLVSIWAILFPVLLIVGLRTGIFTPSEAGAFAVLYAAVVGILLYRELTWTKFVRSLRDTAVDMGMIMTLIAFSGSWSYGLTWDRVPQRLLGFLTGISDNGTVVMLVLLVALLIIGMFMDSTVLILLLTSMLVPVALQLGIDPVHFGVVMILTLTLGLLTPPVGIVMYIVCDQFNTDIATYLKQSIYLFAALLLVILLMIFIPGIVTWLPGLLYGT